MASARGVAAAGASDGPESSPAILVELIHMQGKRPITDFCARPSCACASGGVDPPGEQNIAGLDAAATVAVAASAQHLSEGNQEISMLTQ